MTQKGPWSVWKITLVLYPLGAGAAFINVFFLSLLLNWLGAPVLTPLWSLWLGVVIGVPFTYVFAVHIRKLIEQSG